MELVDFLRNIQSEVSLGLSENEHGKFTYPESMFSEVMMEHMSENGMTKDDPQVCHFERRVRNAKLKFSGYALSEDSEQLDLFISLYEGVNEIVSIPDSETMKAAKQCLKFIEETIKGKLVEKLDESDEAYLFASTLEIAYSMLDQIRIYVLTDKVAKTKNFKPQLLEGKTIKLEVMDIERLYRHTEGKPRDEIILNFPELFGSALPCVFIKSDTEEYDYALTALPGEALRFAYDKYDSRVLEANVRSFLTLTRKANKGIRRTLTDNPERFMAYNNGVVIVADQISLSRSEDGSQAISGLKGFQIVNGGQTTASIFFSKKKNPSIDLRRVRVPAKIIILNSTSPEQEELFISEISEYSNTQTTVQASDLASNKPFHVELEKLSTEIYCPDGVGQWFYERAKGSYNVMLHKKGSTPAKYKKIRKDIPTSRKITKTLLAQCLNAWNQKPELSSLGTEKNFKVFMEELLKKDPNYVPDKDEYKQMIAKFIFFKSINKTISPLFSSSYKNITIYLISLLENRFHGNIDFHYVWENQDISEEMKELIRIWSKEVYSVMEKSAEGKLISEWAKKRDCWEAVCAHNYSDIEASIPEIVVQQ